MKNFIKYEIKGTYKFMLGIITVVLILTTFLQLRISRAMVGGIDNLEQNIISGLPIVLIGVIAMFGLLVASAIYIINSYKKELDDDRGYLTFTLPMTGNQILGSKMLVALFWYFIIGITTYLFNIILSRFVFGGDFRELFKMITDNFSPSMIVFAISNLISISLTIILVYFSITMSRVTFKNRRFGGLWFVLFITLNILFTIAIVKLSTIIPYYLNISNFNVDSINNLASIIPGDTGSTVSSSVVPNTLLFLGNDMKPYLNIVGFVSHILVLVGGFFITGYLLENKINL